MAAINLSSPYAMKAATVTFGDDDHTAAVSQAEFQPSTSIGTWTGVGGNTVTEQSPATWTLALGFAQDDAPSGLLRYLFANEGATVTVTVRPRRASGGTIWTASVIVSPANIGGTSGSAPVTSQVSLAVVGKPVPSLATTALA